MRLNTDLLLVLVLVLAMGMGCSGGGSSSGGSSGGGTSPPPSSSNSLVGSWVLVSGSNPNAAKSFSFKADGTGTYAGSGIGDGALTWTQQGNQATIRILTVGETLPIALNGDTFTVQNGSGDTYKRA